MALSLVWIARRLRWTIAGAIAAGLAVAGRGDRRRRSSSGTRSTRGIVHDDTSALWWACAGIVVLGLVEAIAGGAAPLLRDPQPRAGRRQVRDGIFRRALELDARYHDRVGAGELISRASNDAELVARVFDAIGHTVGYVLTHLRRLGRALRRRLARSRSPCSRRCHSSASASAATRAATPSGRRSTRRQLGELTALAEETIAGIRVVKGLGAGDALVRALPPPAPTASCATALDVADVDAVFLPALEALPLVGILVVLWYGAHRVLSGDDHDRHVRALQLLPRAARLPAADDRPAREHGAARRGRGTPRRRRARGRARRRRGGVAPAASRRGATSASRTSASPTATSGRSSTGFARRSRPARRSRSSARPAPASRRSPRCSRASTTRTAGA